MNKLLQSNATKTENSLLFEADNQNFTLEMAVGEDGYYDVDMGYRHDRWEAYVKIDVIHEDDEKYSFIQGLLHGKKKMTVILFLKKGKNILKITRHTKTQILISYVRNAGKTNELSYEISPKNNILFLDNPQKIRTFIRNYKDSLERIENESGIVIPFTCCAKDQTNGHSASMIDVFPDTGTVLNLGEGEHKLFYTLKSGMVLEQNLTIKNTTSETGLKYINFDVGQANSTLVFLPNGKNMLIDSATDELAQNKIIPYLRKNKVTVDYYLITHFHPDHQGLSDIIIKQYAIDRPCAAKVKKLIGKTPEKRYSYLGKFRYLDSTMLCCFDKIHEIWDLGGVKMEVANSHYDEDGTPLKEYNYSFIKENEHNYENSTSVSFMMDYNGFRYYHSADNYGYCQERYMVDMIKRGRDEELDSHWFYANHHFINDINAKFINTLNPVGVYVPNSLLYRRAAYTHYYKENVVDYHFSHKRLKDTLVSEEVGNVRVCVNNADDWYYDFLQDEILLN